MSARLLSAAALLAALVKAANVNVHNNCGFDVQLTPSHEGADQQQQTINAGKSYSQPADGSAWCLKLYGPGATNPTQLEFSTWGANVLSYDLSDIDMHQDTTFLKYGMSLESQDPSCKGGNNPNCKKAVCGPSNKPDETPCADAYNQPFDPRTLGASGSYDIDMQLCTANSGGQQGGGQQGGGQQGGGQQGGQQGGGQQGGGHSAPPPPPPPAQPQPKAQAPPPAPAPAPQQQQSPPAQGGGHPVQVGPNGGIAYEGQSSGGQPQQQQQGGGNVVTKVVQNTAMVTQYVTARDAEPTAPLARRHAHQHVHHAHHAA